MNTHLFQIMDIVKLPVKLEHKLVSWRFTVSLKDKHDTERIFFPFMKRIFKFFTYHLYFIQVK